jgi:hypothetical protein
MREIGQKAAGFPNILIFKRSLLQTGFRQQSKVFDTGCQGAEQNRRKRQIDFWKTFDYGCCKSIF